MDTMGHHRDCDRACPTIWALDHASRESSRMALFCHRSPPTLYQWAGFGVRPWGEDILEQCKCQEPETSGGRERHWKVESIDKVDAPTRVKVVCSWCGSRRQLIHRSPETVQEELQRIGDTYISKWEYGKHRKNQAFCTDV